MTFLTVLMKVNNALQSKQLNDADIPEGWVKTTATVTACKTLYYTYTGVISNIGIPMPSFAVKFIYKVNDCTYAGRFRSNIGYNPGQVFEISYNPQRPAKNSGASSPPWLLRGGVWIAIILAVLTLYWFSN